MLKSDLSLQYFWNTWQKQKKKKTKNKQTLWRNTPLPRVAKISSENLTRDELTFQNYKTYKETMQQEQQTNDRIRPYKKF